MGHNTTYSGVVASLLRCILSAQNQISFHIGINSHGVGSPGVDIGGAALLVVDLCAREKLLKLK